MNYDVLVAEIRDDPLGVGYSGMTAKQVADSLNTANRPQQGAVPMNQLIRWAATCDGIYALEQATISGTRDKRRLAKAALEMFRSPHVTQFDVTDVELSGMLEATVALGVFTRGEIDSLKARGINQISRATEIGCGPVGDGHVVSAREMMGV